MTGFTWVWTSQALWGGAPLSFVFFSAPFWFAGASMLKGGLMPLFENSRVSLQQSGLQMETTRSILPGADRHCNEPDASCASSSLGFLERAWHTRCLFVTWDDLDGPSGGSMGGSRAVLPADSLVPILRSAVVASPTMVVNGVELGELSVRHGRRTHTWGSQLGMTELRYVRELMLSWARAVRRAK